MLISDNSLNSISSSVQYILCGREWLSLTCGHAGKGKGKLPNEVVLTANIVIHDTEVDQS